MSHFAKATKKKAKARVALEGPPGSGKSWTALAMMRAIVGPQGRIAVIDTERGSASKYCDDFDFEVVELSSYVMGTFIDMIQDAQASGFDGVIIDSLSHAWMGLGGMLDLVDKIARQKHMASNFPAWKDANPEERKLWDAMLGCNMHLIATLRTKTDYVVEEVERNGKRVAVPRKIGLAPIQREGLEYEFDVVAEMDLDHNLVVSKTRCRPLTDRVFPKPCSDPRGKPEDNPALILRDWLQAGAEPAAPPQPAAPEAAPTNGHEAAPEPASRPSRITRAKVDKAVLEAVKVLKIPDDVFASFCNQITQGGTWGDVSDEAAATTLEQLRECYRLHVDNDKAVVHVITRAYLLDMLSRTTADPLGDLLREAKAAALEMQEANS